MESMEQGKQALISSIEADAKAEQAKIVQDAHDQAKEKKVYAQKKVESILQDARDKAAVQAEALKRKITSGVDLEIKRRTLQVQNIIVQDIQSQVMDALKAKIKTPQYVQTLEAWIVEAAVGLGAESAQVNASTPERKLIKKALLDSAMARIEAKTGEAVTLTLSRDKALDEQGVILTAEDGRTAFNNQVTTRLLRNQRQIKRMIHAALFADNAKE